MTLNAAQTRLYVAEDESDTVDVIDTNPNDSAKGTPSSKPSRSSLPRRWCPVPALAQLYGREHQQRDAHAGWDATLRDQWQSE